MVVFCESLLGCGGGGGEDSQWQVCWERSGLPRGQSKGIPGKAGRVIEGRLVFCDGLLNVYQKIPEPYQQFLESEESRTHDRDPHLKLIAEGGVGYQESICSQASGSF